MHLVSIPQSKNYKLNVTRTGGGGPTVEQNMHYISMPPLLQHKHVHLSITAAPRWFPQILHITLTVSTLLLNISK